MSRSFCLPPAWLRARAAAEQLLDVLKQRGGTQIERPRELRDSAQPRLAARALKQGHLGAMQVAGVSESFLRQAGGEPGGPEVRRELQYRIHEVGCSMLADRTSTDNTLRSTGSESYCLRSSGPRPTARNHA